MKKVLQNKKENPILDNKYWFQVYKLNREHKAIATDLVSGISTMKQNEILKKYLFKIQPIK